MTDNEIIKALEDLIKNFDGNAIDFTTISFAFDLIKRQKAEIERLQGYNENLQTANVALSNEILEIKADAIKEFAERLKEKKRFAYAHLGKTHYTVYEEDIDNLVQEMVGEEDG